MVVTKMRGLFSVLVLVCLGLGCAQGQLKLPSVFGDHMVLQCGMDVAIWGWAKPNEEVVVILDGQVKVKTKSDEQGRWMAKLPPQPAGGPHELVIAAGNEKIRFTDVLFGEVWLCYGQSNMAWALKLTQHAPKEISEANYPQIRIFVVGQAATLKPQNDCKGHRLPNSWAGKDLVLHLGTINDQDTTYFNGEQVGSTQEAKFVRRYKVSGQLVKAGDNLIAVRVFNRWGAGGFVGVPSQMFLELAGGSEKLPLAGSWKFKVEFARSQSELPPQPKPVSYTHLTLPTILRV